jgi:hypothetical protein
MTFDLEAWITAEARRCSRIRHEAIEQACEKALQGGRYGVLVIEDEPTSWRIGPHPSVPYGHIHYAPAGYEPPSQPNPKGKQ